MLHDQFDYHDTEEIKKVQNLSPHRALINATEARDLAVRRLSLLIHPDHQFSSEIGQPPVTKIETDAPLVLLPSQVNEVPEFPVVHLPREWGPTRKYAIESAIYWRKWNSFRFSQAGKQIVNTGEILHPNK